MAAVLVILTITILFTFGVVELLGVFNNAEAQTSGISSGLQDAVGSFREVLGVLVMAVVGGLLFATLKVFQKD